MPKPASHFGDTIFVKGPAAVFFYPDSFQVAAIRAGLDTMVYRGIMHDYEYQMRYCHNFLKSEWPGLQIKEAGKYRYLVFVLKGNASLCIDLDSKPDMYGLFVSDGNQPPIQVEMTNIRTQVPFYMAHRS